MKRQCIEIGVMGKTKVHVIEIIGPVYGSYWYVDSVGKQFKVSGVDETDYEIAHSEAPELLGKASIGYVLKWDCKIIS